MALSFGRMTAGFVYLSNEARLGELIRISVPAGKVQRVLDLKRVTWAVFCPVRSVFFLMILRLLMLDRSRNIEEIYRLELQYQ